MTFSCKHHEFATDRCTRLKTDCIMGRPGCVLEGRVTLTEESIARIENLAKEKEHQQGKRRDKPES